MSYYFYNIYNRTKRWSDVPRCSECVRWTSSDSLMTTEKKPVIINSSEVEMTHRSPSPTAIKQKVCLPCQYTVTVDTLGTALRLLCGFQQETYLIPGLFLYSLAAVKSLCLNFKVFVSQTSFSQG